MDVQEFIGKRRMNVSQLAKDIGYSRQHIQSVADGRIKPGKKLIKALEDYLEKQTKPDSILRNDNDIKN